jgi:hypothetical protein
MEWSKPTVYTGFTFSKGDVSGSAAGSRLDMVGFDCLFIKPSLI